MMAGAVRSIRMQHKKKHKKRKKHKKHKKEKKEGRDRAGAGGGGGAAAAAPDSRLDPVDWMVARLAKVLLRADLEHTPLRPPAHWFLARRALRPALSRLRTSDRRRPCFAVLQQYAKEERKALRKKAAFEQASNSGLGIADLRAKWGSGDMSKVKGPLDMCSSGLEG